MGSNIKHIQIRTDPLTYKKLRRLCAERGLTLQALFTRTIQDLIKTAPESQEREG